MNSIEMIDRQIATLEQNSINKQRELLSMRDAVDIESNIEKAHMEETIKSLQKSISNLKLQKNQLLNMAYLR